VCLFVFVYCICIIKQLLQTLKLFLIFDSEVLKLAIYEYRYILLCAPCSKSKQMCEIILYSSEMFGWNKLKSKKYLVLEIWYRNKVPALNKKTKIIDLNLATFRRKNHGSNTYYFNTKKFLNQLHKITRFVLVLV
jgi:hypothetical protein